MFFGPISSLAGRAAIRKIRKSRNKGATIGGMLGVAGGALTLYGLYRAATAYDLTNRVAVVTGGGRGLGLVIARELAEHGARLALLGRDHDELNRARSELSAGGTDVLAIKCDVRIAADIESAAERIVGRFGTIDVLINNAGVIQVGPFEHMTDQDFESSMDVHFWGPLNMIRAVLPIMRHHRQGRIVNIVSIGGKLGVPHLAPYCASKFALAGLGETLGAELRKDGIRVTNVFPGTMRTGSHLNALFKGRNEEEFTWFAIGDSLPLISMSARRAARKIVSAMRHGDAQLIMPLPAKLAAILHELTPEMMANLFSAANRWLLPAPSTERGTASQTGWESRSRWSGSLLTRLADRATTQNNGLAGHQPPA